MLKIQIITYSIFHIIIRSSIHIVGSPLKECLVGDAICFSVS